MSNAPYEGHERVVTNVFMNAGQKTGMTVAELRHFIDECFKSGMPSDKVVKIKTGWRQQILTITTGSKP